MNLSSGQKRAMIARALFSNPDVILLDEITNFLDRNSREKIINYFREIIKLNNNIAIIWVSHSDDNINQILNRRFTLVIKNYMKLNNLHKKLKVIYQFYKKISF